MPPPSGYQSWKDYIEQTWEWAISNRSQGIDPYPPGIMKKALADMENIPPNYWSLFGWRWEKSKPRPKKNIWRVLSDKKMDRLRKLTRGGSSRGTTTRRRDARGRFIKGSTAKSKKTNRK